MTGQGSEVMVIYIILGLVLVVVGVAALSIGSLMGEYIRRDGKFI